MTLKSPRLQFLPPLPPLPPDSASQREWMASMRSLHTAIQQLYIPLAQRVEGMDHVVDGQEMGVKADGVTDDTVALQRAVDAATDMGVVLLPPGIIKVTDTITVGNGSITTASTQNGVRIRGAGYGSAAHKNGTRVRWDGSAGDGPIFNVLGPIHGVHFGELFIDGNQLATTGISLKHSEFGYFHNLRITNCRTWGLELLEIDLDGYPTYDGANHNMFVNIHVNSIYAGAGGFKIGDDAAYSNDPIGVSQNVFINCHARHDSVSGATTAWQFGFVDSCSFINCLGIDGNGTGAASIRIKPSSTYPSYPDEMAFYLWMGGPKGVVDSSSGTWAPGAGGLFFWPFQVGDSSPLLDDERCFGVTTEGKLIGRMGLKELSPAQITSNQNDYNPTGLGYASCLRLNTDASRTVTGLQRGRAGRILVIHNTGLNDLVLAHESASSTAAYRINCPTGVDLTVQSGEGVWLFYDSVTSRWRVIDRAGGGTSSALVELRAATFDGGGSAIAANSKARIMVPYACTISEWTILADQSGSIVIDIWKDTYANYPPTVADTITGSAKPTVTSAIKGQSSTLTGWTTAIAAGDTLVFNVDSCSTITQAVLILKVTRS